MSTISTAIELNDRMSSALMVIDSNVNDVIDSIYNVSSAYDEIPGVQMLNTIISTLQSIDSNIQGIAGSMSEVTSNTGQALTKMDNIESAVRESAEAQKRYNDTINQTVSGYDGLIQKVESLLKKVTTAFAIDKIIDTSDELTSTTARINLMNDGLQSTEDLMSSIYQAANGARGSYFDMASAVAKLGNNAGDAFSSSQEIVNFAELVQKQFAIAGASTTEASNAMLQLTQALGSGVLRGDELNSIFEQAPNLIQSIADYMGVSIGEIRNMASEGQITADIVKNAMFTASDDINAKFAQMPMTFSQLGTQMANNAIVAFQPLLSKLNSTLNSTAFQDATSGLISALYTVSDVASEVFDTLITAGAFVYNNWSVIAPIFFAVAGALLAYNMALGVHNAILAVTNGIKTIAAIRAVAHGTATAGEAAATVGMTTAQMSFNAALYACPLTWILAIIVVVIAAVYAVIAIINQVTGSTISGTGIICGAIATAGAAIWNIILGLVNMVIGIGVEIWNLIAVFANFFANVFNDPVGAIVNLFLGLFDTILGIVQSVAKLIDTVVGTDLAGAVSGFRNDMAAAAQDIVGDQVEVMAKLNAEDYQFDGMDYGDAFGAGYEFGEGIDDKISSMFDTSQFDESQYEADNSYNVPAYEEIAANTGSTASGVSDISKSVDISSENLKYLRDIAEQDTINRFTTAEIKVDMTNNNNVSSGVDIEDMIVKFTGGLNEALDEVAKGVHV